jgi:hypothetical protein
MVEERKPQHQLGRRYDGGRKRKEQGEGRAGGGQQDAATTMVEEGNAGQFIRNALVCGRIHLFD